MKRLYSIFAFLLFLLPTAAHVHAQAGCTAPPYPGEVDSADAFGYDWKSDTVTGGPSFNWINIESPGNEVTGLTDDNFVGPFNIGFDFNYFWYERSQFWIGSNGYIIFSNPKNIASGANAFITQPNAGGANDYIAALLSDLTFTDSDEQLIPNAKVFHSEINDSTHVITYKDVPYWTGDNARAWQGRNSFQVVLHEDGRVNLNYQSVSDSIASAYINGNFITRGMENLTGNVGFCLPSVTVPDTNSAIEIDPPDSTSFQVTDVSMEWVGDSSNGAQVFTFEQGIPNTQALVKNSGTQSTTPFNVQLRVFDFLNTQGSPIVVEDTVTVPSLQPDETSLLTFTKPIPINEVSNYRITARLIFSADENSTNNERSSEIVFIDDSIDVDNRLWVGYDRWTFSEHYGKGNVAPWDPNQDGLVAGGGLKSGVFISTPTSDPEPDTLEQLGVYMQYASLPDSSFYQGFKIEVFDNNNGQPGSKLFETTWTLDSLSIPPLGQPQLQLPPFTERVAVDPPVIVNNGGIFVSYDIPESIAIDTSRLDSLGNFMLTDEQQTSPASNRTFEISGGQWAPHRNREDIDFGLRAAFAPEVSAVTGREEGSIFTSGKGLELRPAFPNPARQRVTLPYTLQESGTVRIQVRNSMGQVVRELDLGRQASGEHNLQIPLGDLSSGVYLYTLQTENARATGRLIRQ